MHRYQLTFYKYLLWYAPTQPTTLQRQIPILLTTLYYTRLYKSTVYLQINFTCGNMSHQIRIVR